LQQTPGQRLGDFLEHGRSISGRSVERLLGGELDVSGILSGEGGMTAGSPDRRSGQQVQGPYMYSDAVLTGPCLSVIRPWISSDWRS
jgi:hypothetical protein